MTISDEHPDPDVREVARRVKPYNLESWYAEWTRVAEKNRQLAAGFENEGRKVTAKRILPPGGGFLPQSTGLSGGHRCADASHIWQPAGDVRQGMELAESSVRAG